jgi:hypothetical protein
VAWGWDIPGCLTWFRERLPTAARASARHEMVHSWFGVDFLLNSCFVFQDGAIGFAAGLGYTVNRMSTGPKEGPAPVVPCAVTRGGIP